MTVINVSIQDLALREIEDELRRSAALLAAGHEPEATSGRKRTLRGGELRGW